MALPATCPDNEQLRRLLDSRLPEAEQADLVAHLDSCPSCQRTLEDLAADEKLRDEMTVVLKGAHTREAPLEKVLEELKQDRTTNWQQSASLIGWLEGLLQLSDSPGAMGRLGEYVVTEVVAQGGMGVVLKGFDPKLRRDVAIKVLAPYLAGDAVARQRFAREGRAAAAVHHENVITIHAVNEVNGVPYIVMEHVTGGSLQDYVASHGPLDGLTIAKLGEQIASGLAAAHERGLIHRDIKPSNLLLASGASDRPGSKPGASQPPLALGVVKIADFGLARVADEAGLTQTGIITGTPMYMSPEQSRGEHLDARTDLFSLGSVLYMLCTGTDPFPASTPMAVLRQVCEGKTTPIRNIKPNIPAWLVEIIERLHAKSPADRFSSAAEVTELIHHRLANPTHPMPPLPLSEKRRARRRALLLAGATVVLMGAYWLAAVLGWVPGPAWLPFLAQGRVPLLATLGGDGGPILSAAFAPQGNLLATGSDDGSVRMWLVPEGRPAGELTSQGAPVYSLAFAHSGSFLVSGSGNGQMNFWSVPDMKELSSRKHHRGGIRRLAVSPDDATIAVLGTDQSVELWDARTGQRRTGLQGHAGTVLAVAFSSDNTTLVTGDSSGTVKLWDPASGEEKSSFRADSLGIRALAFSPTSQVLATAGSGEKNVHLWQLPGGQSLGEFDGDEDAIRIITFAPDGKRLATGSRNGSIRIWDVLPARPLATISAHRGNVMALAFSPDGRLLASGGEDRVAKLWDVSRLGQ